MLRLVLILGLGLAALAPRAGASDLPPLVADRPTQSYSAVVVPAGMIQNELGYTHARVEGATFDALGEWFFRWGVIDDLEVNVLLGSLAWVDAPGAGAEHGWTDGRLGLKWTSQHGVGPRPTAALLLGTSLPTGDPVFREDTLQPEAIIAMVWGLGGRFALGANVGWAWASRDLQRFDRWLGSLVLAADLGRGFGAFVEGFGYLREEPGGSDTGYLDAGVSYLVSPAVVVDARVGAGRNGLDEDWLVGLGVTWRTEGP